MKHTYSFFRTGIITFIMGMAFSTSAIASTWTPPEPVYTDAEDVIASGCKTHYDAPAETAVNGRFSDTTSTYCKVSYQDETLTVTWYDFYANCCPEGFKSFIKTYDDHPEDLLISLREEEGMCDCICPYDITAVFAGIKPGSYYLNIDIMGECYLTDYVELKDGFEEYLGRREPVPADGRLTASVTDVSDCTRSMDPSENYRMKKPMEVPQAWRVRYNDNVLSLTWEHVVGNCATHGFDTWIMPDNNNLDFFIDELYIPGYPLATCVCPFDVDSSFPDIEEGTYTLRFHDYYSEDGMCEVTVELKNGFDEYFTSTILSGITGIASIKKPLRILPGNLLHAEAEGPFSLEIIGADGIAPLRINAEGSTEVCLSNLPAGIYIAKLKFPDGRSNALRFSR